MLNSSSALADSKERAIRSKSGLTYCSAGVHIDAGNRLVDLIKPMLKSTARPGADACIGGFAGLFDPKLAGFEDPLFMMATDGVGSKLAIAAEMRRYDTIGIDLVAMCVNDLIVRGVEPLVFLDYFACGRLDLARAESLIGGIVSACKQVGCAFIGGETAEMPGLYALDGYDLAGFAVGAVERSRVLPERGGKVGDIVLGLGSSGLHANGFSLVRKLLGDGFFALGDSLPFASPYGSWGELLLVPTRLYVGAILSLLREVDVGAIAHITGGGFYDNCPRSLTENLAMQLDLREVVEDYPLFVYLHSLGIAESELLRVFNCGIGMLVVVAEGDASAACLHLREQGEVVYRIGTLVERQEEAVQVRFLR